MRAKLVLVGIVLCSRICFGMEDDGKEKVLTFVEIRRELAEQRKELANLPLSATGKKFEKVLIGMENVAVMLAANRSPLLEETFCTKTYPSFQKTRDALTEKGLML